MICCTPRFWAYVGSMDWQQFVSLMIVAVAGGLLLWGKFRPRKWAFGREGHCGCSLEPSTAFQSSIVFRARKNGRSEVIVKMK